MHSRQLIDRLNGRGDALERLGDLIGLLDHRGHLPLAGPHGLRDAVNVRTTSQDREFFRRDRLRGSAA